MNQTINTTKLVSIKRFVDKITRYQRHEEKMRNIEASLRRRENGFDLCDKKYANNTQMSREVRQFHSNQQIIELPSEFLSLRSNNQASMEHFLPFLSDKALKLQLEGDRKKYYQEVLLHHPAKPEMLCRARRFDRSKSVL